MTVEGQGMTRMDSLQIGDSVLIADGTYSQIYSFGHKATSTLTKYLQICTSDMDPDHPLEISSDHLIYTFGSTNTVPNLVAARNLDVGESLLNVNGTASTVLWIRTVERKGAYSPLTKSGNLLVNGVLASSYVSRRWVHDYVSGEALHYLQHAATGPLRMFCAMTSCKMETYNEHTGFSAYVQFWFAVEQWHLELHWVGRLAFSLVVATPVIILVLLGKLMIMPISVLQLHLVIVAIGYWSFVHENHVNNKKRFHKEELAK